MSSYNKKYKLSTVSPLQLLILKNKSDSKPQYNYCFKTNNLHIANNPFYDLNEIDIITDKEIIKEFWINVNDNLEDIKCATDKFKELILKTVQVKILEYRNNKIDEFLNYET